MERFVQICSFLYCAQACNLAGLGKFSFKLKKMDTGTQGIVEQRVPVFVLSESFIRMYQLRTLKQHVSNEVKYFAKLTYLRIDSCRGS